MIRTFFTASVLGAALTAFSGTAAAACDPTQEIIHVSIVNMAFVPADLEVCVGQTVRWTNNEPSGVPRPMKHTVTADPALAAIAGNVVLPETAAIFASALLLPGEFFEHTFEIAGEYKYICRPHEQMGHLGRLEVLETGE